ncbi:MAG: hypothetical protein FJX65_06660 [Alphaproteobacteria bacterium]|nr:hypothetical protein [Alphaproteobacteria bacterium]
MTHVPALLVLLPFTAAALCLLLPIRPLVRLFGLVAPWVSLGVAALVLDHVLRVGPLAYAFGDWAAPSGVVFRADGLSALALIVTNLVAAVLLPLLHRDSAAHPPGRTALQSALALAFLGAINGIALSHDLFSLIILIEIMTLATCGLIAAGRIRRSLVTAFHALVFQSTGTAFLLMGTAMLYARAGSVDLLDLAGRLAGANDRATTIGAAMVLLGLAIKGGLFPFHGWLSRTYIDAPAPIAAVVGGIAPTAIAYVLLRISTAVLGGGPSFLSANGAWGLAAVAALFVLAPSALAALQRDIRPVVALLAAAHLGYVAVGAGAINLAGATAGMAVIVAHGVAVTAAVAAIGCLQHAQLPTALDQLGTLRRRSPMVAAALACALFAFAGVPLTVGFAGRWHVALGMIERDAWAALILVALSSGVALIAAARVAQRLLFGPVAPIERPVPFPLALSVPATLFGLATVYFGLNAALYVGLADEAAKLLMRGPP